MTSYCDTAMKCFACELCCAYGDAYDGACPATCGCAASSGGGNAKDRKSKSKSKSKTKNKTKNKSKKSKTKEKKLSKKQVKLCKKAQKSKKKCKKGDAKKNCKFSRRRAAPPSKRARWRVRSPPARTDESEQPEHEPPARTKLAAPWLAGGVSARRHPHEQWHPL